MMPLKSVEETNAIKEEISKLKETGRLLKMRPLFFKRAKEALGKLSPEEVEDLYTSILDSSKRSSIISRIVNSLGAEWLRFIKETFFSSEDKAREETFIEKYQASYEEISYSKNIVGAMKESAFLSSHGPGSVGLSSAILGDMTWSIWSTLFSSLKPALNRDLTTEESYLLAEQVLTAQEPLIELWKQTVKNSRIGLSHEGILPAHWKQLEEQEKLRLAEIKKRGTDAQWHHSASSNSPPVAKAINVADLRRILETRLQFPIRVS